MHTPGIQAVIDAMRESDNQWNAALAQYQTKDGEDIRDECRGAYEQAKDDAGWRLVEMLPGWRAELEAAVKAEGRWRDPLADGEPTNADNAEFGRRALLTYLRLTYSDPQDQEFSLDEIDPERALTVIGDLMADLLHLSQLAGADPELVLDRAREFFDEEAADRIVETADAEVQAAAE